MEAQPSTTTSSGLDSWDPLAEESDSFFNTSSYDLFNPECMITGGREWKESETPCKYYNGVGEKCHRKGCNYSHDKLLAKGRLLSIANLCVPKQPVEVFLLEHLKPKQRAPNEMMNVGILGSATNPQDFFIIPYGDWSCACKKTNIDDRKEGSEEFTGVDSLTEMWKDLDYFTSCPHSNFNQYVQNQLVAVKVVTTGKIKQWCRAIVLDDVVLGDTNKLPEASLRLLDFGAFITATTKEIIPLPKALLRYPPLGYHCALFGISPLRHQWSSKAINLFRSLVHGQECIFIIRQPTKSKAVGEVVFDYDPYLVDLHVKVDGKYVDIADCLEKEGYGLFWHPFPNRPFVLKNIPDVKAFTSLFTRMDSCHSELSIKIPQEVQERESQRVRRYLNRSSSKKPGELLKSDNTNI